MEEFLAPIYECNTTINTQSTVSTIKQIIKLCNYFYISHEHKPKILLQIIIKV